ncbi:ectoine/hydroxyectoine ABC transporter permease subunit EhuD [Paenibacillus daejeonensis]|uniref:ectoine/hydroxyectoine ABC transporter permease subunit EhuD n=1 Tax=Paenibacillus daejeonensis TaxID=135193 RepID=UPI00037BFB00
MIWSWEYAWSVLPLLLDVIGTTLLATLFGFLIACTFGMVLAVLGRSRFRVIRWTVNGFIEFVRNTPLLVQLFFLFYALPLSLGISMSAFTTGVIGLGLHYSTYLAEVYRSGINGVEKGQWEAARALNFSKQRTWTRIILPQAIPPILPIMGNYLIVVFKETPLLAAITVMEMLSRAKNIVSRDWRPTEPYTLVGILFLVISLLLAALVSLLEYKMAQRQSK